MIQLSLPESGARKPLLAREGALVSVATHAATIALVLLASPPDSQGPARDEPERERVMYLIPLDRVNEPRPQEEALAWVDPGALAGNAGFERRAVDADAAVSAAVAGRGREEGTPERSSDEQTPIAQYLAVYDSVATELEVDSAAERAPESAAPSYPPSLLAQRIEGSAYVRFVVDTTGLADTASFQVITATHPEFGRAVREALPGMRFRPAVQQSRKVRQLVEQPFGFRITTSTSQARPDSAPAVP